MSDKSPLFVSALELVAHATELYAEGKPRKQKFVVLHLANAIELILKDALIDRGVSIYKNPKETISITDSFNKCAEVNILLTERPVLDLLIDDRNVIQHRFGYPDVKSIDYYVSHVVDFFIAFLSDNYGLSFAETMQSHLTEDLLTLIGLVPDEFAHLNKLAEVSPSSAILKAYVDIENGVRNGASSPLVTAKILQHLFSNKNPNSPVSEEEFSQLRQLRNLIAHGTENEYQTDDWKSALQTAKSILTWFKNHQDAVLESIKEVERDIKNAMDADMNILYTYLNKVERSNVKRLSIDSTSLTAPTASS